MIREWCGKIRNSVRGIIIFSSSGPSLRLVCRQIQQNRQNMGENGVLWVSSAVNFPVVCSCLRVALACTPKLERHHAERALRRSRDLLGQEPTSPSLRAPNDMGKSAPKRASDADQDERPAEAKDDSGQEPPPSGAGGGTDGAPAAPPAPVDSAEELRVLRKQLERLEAQAAQPVAQPDGGDPPPGGGGGGGDGGGAEGWPVYRLPVDWGRLG